MARRSAVSEARGALAGLGGPPAEHSPRSVGAQLPGSRAGAVAWCSSAVPSGGLWERLLAGAAATLSRHWILLRTFLRRCGAVASFSSVEARRAAAKASSCVRSLAVLSYLALQALAELEYTRSSRSASLESQCC